MSNFNIFDARLKFPFSLVIAGPSQSGKSTWVCDLIEHAERLIDTKINKVIWFYGEMSDTIIYLHAAYGSFVETVKGLPTTFDDYLKPGTLIVLDDLYAEAGSSHAVAKLFTRQSHHRKVGVILITQNIFSEGRQRKTITKSAHYWVLFNNPLDRSVAYSLGLKIMPQDVKTFMQIYNAATNKPHGMLFIDGTQDIVPEARFRSDIFNPKFQLVYIPL